MKPKVLPVSGDEKHYQIAFNAIPQIDKFQDNGFTFEEMKMINETKKIMHMPELRSLRHVYVLPVVSGHSESVYIEIDREGVRAEDLKELIKRRTWCCSSR